MQYDAVVLPYVLHYKCPSKHARTPTLCQKGICVGAAKRVAAAGV